MPIADDIRIKQNWGERYEFGVEPPETEIRTEISRDGDRFVVGGDITVYFKDPSIVEQMRERDLYSLAGAVRSWVEANPEWFCTDHHEVEIDYNVDS